MPKTIRVKVKTAKLVEPVKAEKYFIIDAENVALTGITGIENVKGENIIAYHRNPICKGVIKELQDAGASIQEISKECKKENCADEFIMMRSIELITKAEMQKKKVEVYCISKDRDIDKLLYFYNMTYNNSPYTVLQKHNSIMDYLTFNKIVAKDDKMDVSMSVSEFLESLKGMEHISQSDINCFNNLLTRNRKNKKETAEKVLKNLSQRKKLSYEHYEFCKQYIETAMKNWK